jgi:hypothetical protein
MSWKELKRHQLSAEYSDWDKETRDEVLAQLKENNGLFEGQTIWTYEGMVIDGWQRLTVSARANIRPTIKVLPKGIDPVKFVRAMNDCRRHEPIEVTRERASKRRERVAAARKAGDSLRTIAERENVSVSTVHEDLNPPNCSPRTVAEQPDEITGKDGKTRPATQPKILCGRCKRLGNPVPNCEACKEERKAARSGRDAGSSEPATPRSNNGKPLWDWKDFTALWAKLLRQVDQLGNRFKCKDWPEAEKLRDGLAEWRIDFKALFAKATKSKAPKD